MQHTGIIADSRYLAHLTGRGHPEGPERLHSIYSIFDEEAKENFVRLQPRIASVEEVGLIHDPDYIDTVASTAGKGDMNLDPDTHVCGKSFEIARLAVGGVLVCVDHIVANKIKNAFALVRPPGHHAERARAMGFCLFNNIAIGAQYALKKHNIKRILIVDWDLHHGNGTQSAFYTDAKVLYFSTHQFPHYPGTGDFGEVGKGDGEGFTVNVPLPPGMGDNDYIKIFKDVLAPIAQKFDPELVMVSAGFDTYFDDPLGGMSVTPAGFAALTEIILQISNRKCLFVLEGGYNLNGLKDSVKAVIKTMIGQNIRYDRKSEVQQSTFEIIDEVKRIHSRYWDFKE